jgi:hypothetical protein
MDKPREQRLPSMPQPSKAQLQKSLVATRAIRIGNRNFGISVEAPFWAALKELLLLRVLR